jgi:hypothetical protein
MFAGFKKWWQTLVEDVWNTIDEFVEVMAWMRKQRAYANINKEAERREMERIRKGEF